MQLNAAPFAALFLMLTIVAATLQHSKGLSLRVAMLGPCGTDDRRVVVVQALSHGRLKINADEVKRDELGDNLEAIFRTRAERLVFVTAEPDLRFRDVADVIDTATRRLVHVALLPPLNVLFHLGLDICPKLILRSWQVDTFHGKSQSCPHRAPIRSLTG